MRKINALLTYKFDKQLSHRAIAKALSISPATVSGYSRAFIASGLNWQTVSDWSNEQLLNALLPHCQQRQLSLPNQAQKIVPDFVSFHQEMKVKGINLQLLWDEYQQAVGETKAYSYSQLCLRYRTWCKRLKPSLRLTHKAGEKAFLDFCGPKVAIYSSTGQVAHQAYIFVALLGASNYTFATACLTRNLNDWTSVCRAALEYFGGVPECLVPDNEKSAVKKACKYDPSVNPTYLDFAHHYGTIILPTRPYSPKDKAKVEKAVQIVETWIIGRLRHQRFYSLAELNQGIVGYLEILNHKPFKQLPGTRHSQFIALDKPALNPLPKLPYELAHFQQQTVQLDYHVCLHKHYYSVPYQLVKKKVECRITASSVEIFYQHDTVAKHLRNDEPGTATTLGEHMPAAHLAHKQWTPAAFYHWAKKVGVSTLAVAEQFIETSQHPERCYRVHNGMRKLLSQYGSSVLDKACHYAMANQTVRFASIQSILKMQLANQQQAPTSGALPQQHDNVRGADYFTSSIN